MMTGDLGSGKILSIKQIICYIRNGDHTVVNHSDNCEGLCKDKEVKP